MARSAQLCYDRKIGVIDMCFKKDSKMAEYIMMNSYVPVDRVISAIRALDADGNGLITLGEVIEAVKGLFRQKV